MADDGCQVAGGELKMGDEQCAVEAGGCDQGQSSEPMTEASSGPVVGHDSQRVTEDATDDKIGILSHEGAHAAGQPGQGDGVGQCLPDDSQRVTEDATDDKIGILSHEGAHAAGQPGQGDGVGQCLPDDAAARRTLAASPFPQWQARLRRSFTGGIF